MTGLNSIIQYANNLINRCLSILAFLGVGRGLRHFLRNFLRKFQNCSTSSFRFARNRQLSFCWIFAIFVEV